MTPYLYAHPNRNAPIRANGVRFHGYPTRSQKVRLVGLHTTESLFDQIGQDTGAEGVARYQSQTDRPSSYHRIVDRDSTVVCLPDEATAFGIGRLNAPTLHLAFALRAADWSDPKKARAALPMLERAADVCAEWSREFGIPLTWLSRDAAFGKARGFIRHGTADPTRRSDPGKDFPADLFFDLIADRLAPQEDDMPLTDQDVQKVVAALTPVIDDRIRLALSGKDRAGNLTGHYSLEHVRDDLARLDVPRKDTA